MERPEVVDPLKEEEEQPIFRQTPVEEQTDDAFSVREQAEKRLGKVGTSALDFVPIVGDVLAAGDVADSYRRGDTLGTAVNLAALGVGVVPIIGDLASKGIKKGFSTYRKASKVDDKLLDKGMEDIADADVAPTVDMRTFAKDFKRKQNNIDKQLENDKISVDEWDKKTKDNNEKYKEDSGIDISDKDPELFSSALKFYNDIEKGVPYETARAEHLKTIAERKPIREWDDLPEASSEVQQVMAVDAGKRKNGFFTEVSKKTADKLSKKLGHPIRRIKIPKGHRIRGRLDVNAYTYYNTWVSTLLAPGLVDGRIYGDAVHYVAPKGDKVKFNVTESVAKKIATGEINKTPFAIIDGLYDPMTPAQIRKKVKTLLKAPEWTQVGFDPRRLTGFYTRNKADNQPIGSLVESADEVFQIGPLILAKNVKRLEEQRLNKGGAIKTYKEGGVVPMQEQMKFAFMNEGGVLADDGINRDPVSGNEVPSGSMAKEVRDDVPAMLSEGEYVVPADVVRYHGIDKFEQLRDEAKMGLARMEADGRIGGQPVEEQEEFPFPIEELQGFDEGGAVGDIYSDVMGSPFTPNQRYTSGGRFPGTGFELRNFTDPNSGRTVVIPFFNGRPMQYIPPEFIEGGAATTRGGTIDPAADERSRQEDEAERTRGQSAFDLPSGFDDMPSTPPKSPSEMSPLELQQYMDQRDSVSGRLLANVPVLGFLLKLNDKQAKERAFDILAEGVNPETNMPLGPAEVSALRAVTERQDKKGFLEAIVGWATGQRFFDPNPRYGYESGQDFRQMYPDLLKQEYTPAPKTAPDFVTMSEIGTSDPTPVETQTQELFPTELGEQESGFADASVAEEAGEILKQERKLETPKDRLNRYGDAIMRAVRGVGDILSVGGFSNIVPPAGASTMDDYTGPDLVQEVSPFVGGGEITPGTIEKTPDLESDLLNFEAGVSDIKNLSNSRSIKRAGGIVEKDGEVLFKPYQVKVMNVKTGKVEGETFKDGTPKYTIGAGHVLPKGSDPNQTRTQAEVENFFYEDLNIAKNSVNSNYNTDRLPPDIQKTLVQMTFQLGEDGLKGFRKMNEAIAQGNYKEAALQIKNNYQDEEGNYLFSTDPNVTKVSPTDYYRQTTDRVKTYANYFDASVDEISGAKEFAQLPPAAPTGLGGAALAGQGESQPLDQTFVPPQAPTAEQVRLAGGIDAFARSQLPTGTGPMIPELNPLDQSYVQRESMGADIGPLKRPVTPVVKRDFLDPNMAMSRREELSDPRAFRGPTGAGLGPMMTDDEKTALDLARGYSDPYGGIRFQERGRPSIDPSQLQPSISPAIDQTEAMFGDAGGARGRLPQVDTTTPFQDFAPLGTRKVTDAKSFLEERKNKAAKDAIEQAAKDAIDTALLTDTPVTKKEPPKKPKKKKAPPKKKKQTPKQERKVPGRTIEEAKNISHDVFMQTGDAFAADRAYHEAFTGFTADGELSPTYGFKEGGLASRPKKTKPKKRNIKNGLGGKMAT